MWIRSYGWLTFKQCLIGFVPSCPRMQLVDGQRHLTLLDVRGDCCFSRGKSVKSCPCDVKKPCWFREIELFVPFNFPFADVGCCYTSDQRLLLLRERRGIHIYLGSQHWRTWWLANSGIGYRLGVFVYMFMCYLPMWVSMHCRTHRVSAPADWGNELGPPEVIVLVQVETRIDLFQSLTGSALWPTKFHPPTPLQS